MTKAIMKKSLSMKMGSFKICLSCPCLLFLECLVLGTSTSGDNTRTSDRPQLLAMWYQVRRHIISRNREQNRLFTKYFLTAFPYVLLESKTKIDLSCFVVSYFLRSQGLYFIVLGQVVCKCRHVSYNLYLKCRNPYCEENKMFFRYSQLFMKLTQ